MAAFSALIAASALSALTGPIFELDLFINDPVKGFQPTGWPQYLQTDAAKYMNVAGISFIQPADLMNDAYVLPSNVSAAVKSLRKQGVYVQLLVGGEVSHGWPQLSADPSKAAANALKLMHAHDVGIEVDDEAGGNTAGIVQFIKLLAKGKPSTTHLSMDVSGTPTGYQKDIIQGAIADLDWVNLMVSTPTYDQSNSVTYAHKDGVPYDKITVAYYAGTWVNNCNTMGSASNVGDTANGVALVKKRGLKGLSIWAVGGASYANCKSTDAPGFSAVVKALGA